MFGLLRLLVVLIIVGYAFCWWRSKRDPDPRWLLGRKLFARGGFLLLALFFLALIVRRLA